MTSTGSAPGRRLLVATAVARYLNAPHWNRPGLDQSRQQVIDLFTRDLGYTHVSDLGLDPTEHQLTEHLHTLCRHQVRPEDHLVVYIAGHGEVLDDAGGRHVLLTADTDPHDITNALPTLRLADKMLLDTPVQRLLLLMDTCYSGAGGNQVAAAVLAGMQREWTAPRPGLVVVTSTQPFEQAQAGAFPTLLTAAVHTLSSAGQVPAALDLGCVVDSMNTHTARPGHQHIGWTALGLTGPLPDFLPTPRHRPGKTGIDMATKSNSSAVSTTSDAYGSQPREEMATNAPSMRVSISPPPGYPPGDHSRGSVGTPIYICRGIDEYALVDLLTQADSAILVDVTHDTTPGILRTALANRIRTKKKKSFFDHVKIVFLAEELLLHVRDDLYRSHPDSSVAFEERKRRASRSKRELAALMQGAGNRTRWDFYSYPAMLPFAGAFLSLQDGSNAVQLKISAHGESEEDALRIHFPSGADGYIGDAFHEIVLNSRTEQELVVVGSPGACVDKFRFRTTRPRHQVLVDGQNPSDWLATVLIATWRQGSDGDGRELLLQVNTARNSTRETGKISSVSGYVQLRDCEPSTEGERCDPGRLISAHSEPLAAVRREMANEFGMAKLEYDPEFISTLPYIYARRESLFFYLYHLEIPAHHRFRDDHDMSQWSIPELEAVRRVQVLAKCVDFLRSGYTGRQAELAKALAVMNLQAHGEQYYAELLRRADVDPESNSSVINELQGRIDELPGCWRTVSGEQVRIMGLAGLQYRIFFSHLLPLYTQLKIRGADELTDAIRGDKSRSDACAKISELYANEDYMRSFKLEV